MQKKHISIAGVLTIFMLILLMATPCFAAGKSGFVTLDKAKRYYDYSVGNYKSKKAVAYYRNGKPVNGWLSLGTDKYYFDSDGTMHWGYFHQSVNGKSSTYYFDPDSGKMAKLWKNIGGRDYYFGNNGMQVRGIVTINNRIYSLTSDGAEGPGWQKSYDPNAKRMYFQSNHAAATGWHTINGQKYHFASNGYPDTGLRKLKGVTYYFGSKGVMQTGWQYINRHWYYFDKGSGAMAVRDTIIQGRTYKFQSSGICTNKTAVPSADWLSGQVLKEEKARFSDNACTMVGRLKIAGLVDVRVLKCPSNLTQRITDELDSAAWIEQGTVYISDHRAQDFYKLDQVKVGTRAVIADGTRTMRYVCTETGIGKHAGTQILDKGGRPMNQKKGIAFCTYTCTKKPSGYIDRVNVFYATWKQVS